MMDIMTEKSVEEKNNEYRTEYDRIMENFINARYSPDQFDLNAKPVAYIKIISADKSIDLNPAGVMREQIQKALMALWTVKTRFQMIIRYDSSSVGVFVGAVGADRYTVEGMMKIYKSSVSGIEFDLDAQNNIKVYSFEQIWGKPENTPCSIGSFMGNPIVCEYSEEGRNISPIDEIIDGSRGMSWMLCISAVPICSNDIRANRSQWYDKLSESSRYADVSFSYGVVGNNRSMNIQAGFTGAKLYNGLAEAFCNVYDEAMQCGQWQMGAVCFADNCVVRDIFGGILSAHMKSGNDPLKRPMPFEYRESHFNQLKSALQIPHSSACTIVSTRELSTLCMLPVRDTCGFRSVERPEFDVYRSHTGDLSIGKIVSGTYITDSYYRVNLDSINRHGLIIGLTGGGKTNTVKNLLYSFYHMNRPFMVIEPAKKEYYEIYNMGIKDLKIYTVGLGEGTPLYINPFEPAMADGKRVSLQSHIDAVFAAFKASFIMYTPMPYVLENAIYAIYRDYGWDTETGVNLFGREDFPTIEDLYFKIGSVVREMGYDAKMQADLIGSLKARINSLRVGVKGTALNVAESVSIESLLNGHCVIELDDVNDEDVKAFIISLLLLRIQECRRLQKTVQLSLRHVLLIEEAHRLLKNVSSGTGENADPRGNAVEFFCNMLAELRSKGQGFLVIDQSPSKLAPDLVRNTNLKIIHRTVASEDRQLAGGAMNMTQAQMDYLSCLKQGYAAVYSEGDNRPKIVKLPYAGNYENEKLDREAILSAVSAGIQRERKEFVNQIYVNPICRHCRRCSEILMPENTVAKICGAGQTKELHKMYDERFDIAFKDLKKKISDGNQLRCMLAAWFAANDEGKSNYEGYSKALDFSIGMLFGRKENVN